MKTFSDYQEEVAPLAVYPGQGEFMGLCYVGLGTAGEAGEVADKIKKCWRDDGEVTPERRQQILMEVGDTLWYLSQVCTELGSDFSEVAQMNIDKLHDRHARNVIHGDGDDR